MQFVLMIYPAPGLGVGLVTHNLRVVRRRCTACFTRYNSGKQACKSACKSLRC